MTGVTAGILYTFQVFIQPYRGFGIDWTVKLVFIVIIGGIGTIEGPIWGLSSLSCSRRAWPSTSPWHVHLGTIAIIVILVAPKEITGSLQEKLGFELPFARRK